MEKPEGHLTKNRRYGWGGQGCKGKTFALHSPTLGCLVICGFETMPT